MMNRRDAIESLSRRQNVVGIFWDYDCCCKPENILPQLFAQESLNKIREIFGLQLFDRLNVYSKYFAQKSTLLHQLSTSEFEICEPKGQCEDATNHQMCMDILLWLWDVERTRSNKFNPSLVLISKNPLFISLLENLRLRNVNVVILSDFSSSDAEAWEKVSNVMIKSHVNPQIASENISDSEVSYRRLLQPRSPSALEFTVIGSQDKKGDEFDYDGDSPNNFTSPVSSPPYFSDEKILDPFRYSSETSSLSQVEQQEDITISSDEQRLLRDELVLAVSSKNIKGTVSKLRKIYTKQFRGFRIPAILVNITLETGFVYGQDAATLTYADMTFIFGCLQWCFGGQKGDNTESFTYKMNKNIARWLLKDLKKRHFSASLLTEIVPIAISTVQNILNLVIEFEFCLEILQFVNVEKPINVLAPYLFTWGNSPNPAQALRAKDFALHIGMPLSYFNATQMPVPRSNILEQRMPPTMTLREVSQGPFGLSHGQGQVGLPPPAVQSHFNNIGHLSSYPGVVPRNQLSQQLLQILSRAEGRMTGKQLTERYMLEYGEKLKLTSSQLQNVLLGLENVNAERWINDDMLYWLTSNH